jgi:hypothetical protein
LQGELGSGGQAGGRLMADLRRARHDDSGAEILA